jgi:hypothetical protein
VHMPRVDVTRPDWHPLRKPAELLSWLRRLGAHERKVYSQNGEDGVLQVGRLSRRGQVG